MGDERREPVETRQRDGAMYLRVEKSVLACSEAELQERLEFIRKALGQGKIVVLGFARCAFCGVELGEPSGKIVKDGIGAPELIINLCHDCWAKQAER